MVWRVAIFTVTGVVVCDDEDVALDTWRSKDHAKSMLRAQLLCLFELWSQVWRSLYFHLRSLFGSFFSQACRPRLPCRTFVKFHQRVAYACLKRDGGKVKQIEWLTRWITGSRRIAEVQNYGICVWSARDSTVSQQHLGCALRVSHSAICDERSSSLKKYEFLSIAACCRMVLPIDIEL